MINTTRSVGRTRRRFVVLATLVLGAVSMSFTLNLQPGDDLFVFSGLVMAAVWAGGALLAGPMPPGSTPWARTLALGVGVGAVLVGIFLAAGLVVAKISFLREPAQELLAHADAGALAPVLFLTVVSGVSEEMFFRGALYDAVPRRGAVISTVVIYTLTTIGSGVPLLVLAAAFLGVVTALLRRHTNGLVAPIATHLVWSVGMLLLLPTALATGR